jgi:hypothetical protein
MRRLIINCASIALIVLGTVVIAFGQPSHQSLPGVKRSDILRKFPLTRFYDTPVPLPPGNAGDLIRSAPFDEYALALDVQAIRIVYYSKSHNGDLVASSGVVLLPDGKSPAGGWPVIAWAHETNGVARSCAPSLSRNLMHGPFLSMYVSLGYAVIATDYTGLGTNFRNAFSDVRSNAQDLIYSVHAARSAVPDLGPKWIAMGIDEGAMAAVGVAELELESRDPYFLGAVAISRLIDAEDLPALVANESHQIPLELAYGIKTVFPRFEPKDVLSDAALPLYEKTGSECRVREVEELSLSQILKAHWTDNRFVQEFFKQNRLGSQPAKGPLLVITSESDPAFGATSKVVLHLCEQRDQVQFNRYGEGDPGAVIGDSTRDQISWIHDRFAGTTAKTNCPARH